MARRPVLLALLTLAAALSACGKREPTFDERYQDASARISGTAAEIDARIEASGTPQDGASPSAR
ncbi:hypothetical protein [Novosphingobium beihaiensis]|uniref:Lipoprotein n=1 Tax=Novosphingobium beihaiensis TaxID=2930389 RepID=A0ABT0BMY8_9SPHN|nr:hypothetical protein [Novosphingobium beihaiensis]MCJ2186416.1 hypothetical protein [Novosphingobium beihaiensis]